MSLNPWNRIAILLLVALCSGPLSANEAPSTFQKRAEAAANPLSDLVIFNERTGEVFDLGRQLPKYSLVPNPDDPGSDGPVAPMTWQQICAAVFAYCLALATPEGTPEWASHWIRQECLCSSGCLSEERFNLIC